MRNVLIVAEMRQLVAVSSIVKQVKLNTLKLSISTIICYANNCSLLVRELYVQSSLSSLNIKAFERLIFYRVNTFLLIILIAR